jgi:hypothetical protein
VVLRYIVQAKQRGHRRHLHHAQPAPRLPGRGPLRDPAAGSVFGTSRRRIWRWRPGPDDGGRRGAREPGPRAGAGRRAGRSVGRAAGGRQDAEREAEEAAAAEPPSGSVPSQLGSGGGWPNPRAVEPPAAPWSPAGRVR